MDKGDNLLCFLLREFLRRKTTASGIWRGRGESKLRVLFAGARGREAGCRAGRRTEKLKGIGIRGGGGTREVEGSSPRRDAVLAKAVAREEVDGTVSTRACVLGALHVAASVRAWMSCWVDEDDDDMLVLQVRSRLREGPACPPEVPGRGGKTRQPQVTDEVESRS